MEKCKAYQNRKTIAYQHPKKGPMVLCDEDCPHGNQRGHLFSKGRHGVCRTDGLVNKTEESF